MSEEKLPGFLQSIKIVSGLSKRLLSEGVCFTDEPDARSATWPARQAAARAPIWPMRASHVIFALGESRCACEGGLSGPIPYRAEFQ